MNLMKPTSRRITLALFLLLFFAAGSFLLAGSPASARVGSLVSSVGQRAVNLFTRKAEVKAVAVAPAPSARAAAAPNITIAAPPAAVANDLRVVSQSVPNGTSTVTIIIEYDAPASPNNVNALGFSINFNPTYLQLNAVPSLIIVAEDPTGVPNSTALSLNPADPSPDPYPPTGDGSGNVGVNFSLQPVSSSLTAGTHRVLRLPFTIMPAAQCGVVTPISITNGPPVLLSSSGPGGNPLPAPNPVSGTLTVAAPTINITPASLPNGTVNVPYSQQISATGGSGGFTFTQVGGTLPTGLTLSSGGLLSGTPTQSGTFPGIQVRATDTNGCFNTITYSLVIQCPTITLSPTNLPNGVRGTPYSATVSATPVGTYTFAVTAGTFPPGLTLASDGQITGTPTTVTGSAFNFTITATGAGPCTGSRAYTVSIACPTLTLTPAAGALAAATLGAPYMPPVQFSANGVGTHTFAVTLGAVPAGMTLSSAGLLSGTPTAQGPNSFTVTATDSQGCQVSAAYTLQVNCPVITITPAGPALPAGALGTPYSQQLTATGTTGTTTFTVISGTLIPGLTLSSDGLISGTPAFAGTLPFEVRATDVNGCTATISYTLQITCPSITFSPPTLPAASLGVPYSQFVTPSPDLSPISYFFHLGGTSLPPGLSLNSSTGEISGTPTSALNSPYVFTIFVVIGSNCLANQQYSISVQCPLVTLTPPAGPLSAATANSPYLGTGLQFSASGTTGPFTFAVIGGALPAGMTLSPAGLLSGTPTLPGPNSFTIRATSNVNGCIGTAAYTLQVQCPVITLSPPTLPNGTINVAYSQQISAANATGALTFNLQSGTLPTGITLSPAGLLSGTPTQTGAFPNLVVRATDVNGCFGEITYQLTIQCPATITLSPATLPNALRGIPYSATITAAPAPSSQYAFTVTTGALPTGLTLNSTTGEITGTTTIAAGSVVNFTITATGPGPCVGSRAYSITVQCPTITLNPAAGALTAATANSPYSQQLNGVGGVGPYTFALTGGALPAGVTLSPAGLLSGTPTLPGPYSFTVTATDANGCTGSALYTLQVNCPVITITPPTLPTGTLNVPYSQQLDANNTTGTPTFNLISGTLPAGITLSGSGLLSGTPTQVGTFANLQIRATDPNGCQGNITYSLVINCPASITLSPPTLPAASLGVAYSATVSASPTATYTFAVSVGVLPPGLSLNSSNGQITGTPTSAAGSPYNFTISATTAGTCVGTQAYSITVQCPTVTLAPGAGALAAATANSAYSQQFTASGTTGPFTFAVTSGAIPAGTTLSAAGLLSGSPTTPGPYSFTITATSTVNGCSGSAAYTLQVNCSVLTLSPASLPNGTINVAYSQQLTAGNATGAVTFNLQSGTLPTGITLSASGLFSGTPTVTGVFPNLLVRATDVNGCFGERTYQLTIQCPVAITLSPLTLPNAVRGVAYSATITAAPPPSSQYAFSVSTGALPAGLTLNSATGEISGTTTTTQTTPFSFTITATGPGPCVGSRDYTLTVVCPTITLSPAAGALTAATANSPYSQQITPSGGSGPYTFTLTGGALPAGVTLSPAGLISGTPTTPGPYSFTVTATDANQCTGSAAYTLQVNCPILTMTPVAGALTAATAGTPYNQNFIVGNATGTLTFSISAGALPAGLTLSGAGVLSGSPTVVGAFSFSVRAVDPNNCSVVTAYTLQVNCQTITVNPADVPDGTAGVAYGPQNITQVGGIGTVTFAISAGALPTGMTLSSAGVLSGTPTVTGPFNFTVRATDANGCTGTRAYEILIACATITFSPAAGVLPGANTSTNYNQQITVTGTIGTNTFTISAGALPPGITLSTGGLLSGIPTQLGLFLFTVRVQDANGCTETAAYSITVVCGTITITPTTLPAAPVNVPYSQALTAVGGTAPKVFSFTGTLPPGITLSPAGVLSGTPTVIGDFTFTVNVLDANECAGSSSAPYILSVLPCTPITVDPPTIPTGFLGVPYSQTFTQTGAVGAATFSVSGTLPTGLTFANGVLSGTPSQSGVFNFSVNVVDSRGCPGTRAYSLTIEKVAFVQSDDSSGSILIYNFYSSSVSVPFDNTRINITNTSQIRGILVHLFFVDGVSCSVADSYVCLTANQTSTFLMLDMDPGTRGYLVAIAVDTIGCPTNFNFLIGDAFVKTTSGHMANLGAEAVSALADVPSVCDSTSFQAVIPFDGVNYSSLPRVLAVSGIGSPATGNSTLLVVNRIGGNLMTGALAIGSLFGILYDDGEGPHSFGIPSGNCQFAGVLSNSLPRTNPRFAQVIPAGSTGWMKLWGSTDIALLGVAINLNPNTSSSADAYAQGHNLHKLKVTNSASLVIPIFSPGC